MRPANLRECHELERRDGLGKKENGRESRAFRAGSSRTGTNFQGRVRPCVRTRCRASRPCPSAARSDRAARNLGDSSRRVASSSDPRAAPRRADRASESRPAASGWQPSARPILPARELAAQVGALACKDHAQFHAQFHAPAHPVLPTVRDGRGATRRRTRPEAARLRSPVRPGPRAPAWIRETLASPTLDTPSDAPWAEGCRARACVSDSAHAGWKTPSLAPPELLASDLGCIAWLATFPVPGRDDGHLRDRAPIDRRAAVRRAGPRPS